MTLGTHVAFASVLYLGGVTLFGYKPDLIDDPALRPRSETGAVAGFGRGEGRGVCAVRACPLVPATNEP